MSSSQTMTTPTQRRWGVRTLYLALLAVGMGNSMVFAVFPPLARMIGLPDASAGLIYVVAAAFYTVMSQYWGRLSDRIGRRPVILVGLCGAGASLFAAGLVMHAGMVGWISAWAVLFCFTVSRAIFGVFGSANTPASQAYIADRTPPERRTQGIASATAALAVGAAMGPVFAASIAPVFGLAAPLYAAGTLALIAAGVIRTFLPERTPPRKETKRGGGAWLLAFDPRLRAIVLVAVMGWLVHACALQTLGFLLMDRLAVSGAAAMRATGFALGVGALALVACQLLVIPLLKPAPRAAMICGLAIAGLGMSWLALADTFASITIALVLTSFGSGLSRPGAAAAATLAVDADQIGAASGLATSAAGVAFLLTPFFGPWFYQVAGPHAPYMVCAGIAFSGVALALTNPAIARASMNGEAAPAEPSA